MANVTDPLACPIHGTNPQNLIEYITRQRIYDSQYWKEQCFGLTAADVVEKAALHLSAIGGSYGGNSKPTRLLCLILKMLQIQPDEGIVDELINNEEFKYVRALGVFYLRLTGRPAEIYEKLEPLYNDYRKLRFRNPNDWKTLYMDEFIDELLRNDRVCGIALPRLPKREMLEDAGYLDGARISAVHNLIGEDQIIENDDSEDAQFNKCTTSITRIEALLKQMSADGNIAAKEALLSRNNDSIDESHVQKGDESDAQHGTKRQKLDNDDDGNYDDENDYLYEAQQKEKLSKRKKEKKAKKKEKKYGSLFKSAKNNTQVEESIEVTSETSKINADENSDEYWNAQRAKLGLKPLKK